MAYKRGKLKKNGVPRKKPKKRTAQKGEYRDRSGKLKGKKRKKNGTRRK